MSDPRARIQSAIRAYERRHPDAVGRFMSESRRTERRQEEEEGDMNRELALTEERALPARGPATALDQLPETDLALMEKVLVGGDLKELSAEQRLRYYDALCRSLRLNPLSRPFEYVTFDNKLVLYARKDCAEQLRRLHGVSIVDVSVECEAGLCVATATARTPDGRTDIDQGIVSVEGQKGPFLANARMKSVTKAKRRVTLSLCGLGILDETEIDTIPGARPVRVDTATGEILEEPRGSRALPADPREPLIAQYGAMKGRAIALGGKLAPLTREMTAEEIAEMIAVAEPVLADLEARAKAGEETPAP